MTDELTDARLSAIEANHARPFPGTADEGFCAACGFSWPCETSEVVAALRSERTQNAKRWDGARQTIDTLVAELERERTQNREAREALKAVLDADPWEIAANDPNGVVEFMPFRSVLFAARAALSTQEESK